MLRESHRYKLDVRLIMLVASLPTSQPASIQGLQKLEAEGTYTSGPGIGYGRDYQQFRQAARKMIGATNRGICSVAIDVSKPESIGLVTHHSTRRKLSLPVHP